jgi:tetratricopeptide (TPR) repeat protein/DNA-binding winged helix-turn-helix (wHTH) protein
MKLRAGMLKRASGEILEENMSKTSAIPDLDARIAELGRGFGFAGFEARPADGVIRRGEAVSRVEPRVMDLLVCLAAARGEVVSRDELIRVVWRGVPMTDEVISRCAYQLRKALGEQGHALVRTVPKRGYQLTGEVRWPGSEARTEPRATPSTVSPAAAPAVRRRPAPWALGMGIVGIALAIFLTWLFVARDADRSGSTAVSAVPRVLAVLPLLAADGSQESRATGQDVTDELSAALARIEGLRLIGRDSSLAISQSDEDARTRAGQLKVDAIVDGTVRQRGEQLEFQLRLVDTGSARVLWSGEFIAARDDVSGLLVRVVSALSPALSATGTVPPLAQSSNPLAHRLYVLGRRYFHRRTAGSLQQAAEYFRQATEADPGFALAWSGLADTEMLRIRWAATPPVEAITRAEPAAEQALKLAPDLAEAHASLGLVRLEQSRHEDAARLLREASALNPNYVMAHMWLGRALFLSGDVAAAEAAYQQAAELEPESAIVQQNLAMVLTQMGRHSEARESYERALERDPNTASLWWATAYNEWQAGALAAAVRAFRRAFELGLDRADAYGQMACLLVDLEDADSAARWQQQGERMNPEDRWVLAGRRNLLTYRRQFDALVRDGAERFRKNPEDARVLLMTGGDELLRGDPKAARARFEKLDLESDPVRSLLFDVDDAERGYSSALNLAQAYLLTGARDEGLALIDEVENRLAEVRRSGRRAACFDYVAAAAQALRGESAAALSSLRAAIEAGCRERWWMRMDPKFSSLHDEPQWQQIIATNAAAVERERSKVASLLAPPQS